MAGTMIEGARRWDGALRVAVWGGAALLLMAPAVAMRLGAAGVNWTASDFATMGALLLLVCGACEVVLRASTNLAYRWAGGLAIGAALLTVWIDLAVGIVEGPNHSAHLVYLAVAVVGVLGALLSRARANGLAKTLIAMAVVQAAPVVLIVAMGAGTFAFALSIVLTGLWLLCAWLFQQAAIEQSLDRPR